MSQESADAPPGGLAETIDRDGPDRAGNRVLSLLGAFLPGALAGTQVAGLLFFLNPQLPFDPLSILSGAAFYGSLLGVFETSLSHEQEMTARLNDLSNLALSEKDHATYNLLQWFVNEQVEEEASVSAIIAKLRMVGDDGYGKLMIDNELSSRAAPEEV